MNNVRHLLEPDIVVIPVQNIKFVQHPHLRNATITGHPYIFLHQIARNSLKVRKPATDKLFSENRLR